MNLLFCYRLEWYLSMHFLKEEDRAKTFVSSFIIIIFVDT